MKAKGFITGMLLILIVSTAAAKNIDLVTLPNREGVQLTIYNSEDITLVKETRFVTLKKGRNKLQFSWAGTLIDPTSVEFRPLEHAEEIEVADTVLPGQKPQHLIWNIESKFEGQVRVEVTYFTSGLTWRMDYVSEVNPGETKMRFRGYVRVSNNSGEEYEDAEIRLIVGNINLVEKIADLARRRGIAVPEPASARYREMKKQEMRESFKEAEELQTMDGAKLAPAAKAKKIVKEGLSEYFMFTVPGTETIRNGWSKRMEAVRADDIKFDIVYRMRSHQYGARPVRFFTWRNDDEHKLGESPLPNGLIRIFRDNGKDGLSYLGQQVVRYVPIKAEIEVNLGPDDLVVYETRKTSTKRLNFHFHRPETKRPKFLRFLRPRRGKESVDGWDSEQKWIDTIRNYRDKPIVLELQRVWPGDVEYHSDHETKLFDYRTIETTLTVKPRDSRDYKCTVTTHHGENAKQSRIKLK